MNDKNIEEKAKHPFAEFVEKEYKEVLNKEYSFGYLIQNLNEDTILGLIDSYIGIEQQSKDTLTQYKEALRELVDNIEKLNLNLFGTDYTIYVNKIKEALPKAKQLLNNE